MLSLKPAKHYLFNLYGLTAIFLSLLPFMVMINEGLAKYLETTPLYKLIQVTIVPYEVKIVASILYLLRIPATYQMNGLHINGVFLQVTWNCLGWQSILFVLTSLVIGLQGKYTKTSKLYVVMIGFLGTFLLNIGRISVLSLLGGYFPSIFRVVFHDYLAAMMTFVWLFFFWWFSYNFVLEDKIEKSYD